MIQLIIIVKNIDGGTGSFINNFLKLEEIDRRIDIKIAVLEKSTFRKINNNKINYFAPKNFYSEKYQFSFRTLLTFIKEFFWLKRIIDESKPNIILSIDSHCLILAQMLALVVPKKIKFVATIHNNVEAVINHKIPKALIGLIKILIGISLNKADKVICVSKDLSNHLFQFFKLSTKPDVIYYDLSPLYLTKKKQKLKTLNSKSKKTILTISRLFPQKDIKNIIKAFNLLKDKLSYTRLWIVGDGPLKPELKLLVNHLGLKDVKFFGWVDNPLKIMRYSDIFVFSSLWEGFGYTIIEAMSQRLPIIATNTPFGPREILKNGKYGKLIPMANPQEMAKAIYEILMDKKQYEYYSRKSIERAQDFMSNKMIKNYKKLFEKLIFKSSQ